MSNREDGNKKFSFKESAENDNNIMEDTETFTYVRKRLSESIHLDSISLPRVPLSFRVNVEAYSKYRRLPKHLKLKVRDAIEGLIEQLYVKLPEMEKDTPIVINLTTTTGTLEPELVADEVERLRIENRRLRESFKFWKREASTIGKRMKELLAKLKHTKSLLEAAETAMKSSLEVIEDPEYSPDHKLTAIKRLLSEAYLKIRRGGIGD